MWLILFLSWPISTIYVPHNLSVFVNSRYSELICNCTMACTFDIKLWTFHKMGRCFPRKQSYFLLYSKKHHGCFLDVFTYFKLWSPQSILDINLTVQNKYITRFFVYLFHQLWWWGVCIVSYNVAVHHVPPPFKYTVDADNHKKKKTAG